MVDGIGHRKVRGINKERAEPLGEGADVGAEESVNSVGESVVRSESAGGQGGQCQAGAHRVHQVRTWPRHWLRRVVATW